MTESPKPPADPKDRDNQRKQEQALKDFLERLKRYKEEQGR